MGDVTGTQAGSQAGQQFSGSQAGQSGTSSSNGQQGTGSQAGQTQQQQQQEAQLYPGQHEGESTEDFISRLSGALTTARKQAATYRTRLASSGLEGDDDSDQTGAGSQAGQTQRNTQQSSADDRVARLERALADERKARVAEKTTSQLMSALAREGALNPERAIRLIDTSELNIGDDGSVDDPLGAVRALKSSDPYLFGDTRGNADGGAGNAGDAPQDFNAMLRARRNGKR